MSLDVCFCIGYLMLIETSCWEIFLRKWRYSSRPNNLPYSPRFIYEGLKRTGDEDNALAKSKKGQGPKEKTELNAEELKKHFRELWVHDAEVLSYLFPMLRTSTAKYPTDVFFVDVLAVPPPKTRPCQFMGGTLNVHPQSTGLQYVVESVMVMKQVLQLLRGQDLESLSVEAKDMIKSLRGASLELKLDSVWKELQVSFDEGCTGWAEKKRTTKIKVPKVCENKRDEDLWQAQYFRKPTRYFLKMRWQYGRALVFNEYYCLFYSNTWYVSWEMSS